MFLNAWSNGGLTQALNDDGSIWCLTGGVWEQQTPPFKPVSVPNPVGVAVDVARRMLNTIAPVPVPAFENADKAQAEMRAAALALDAETLKADAPVEETAPATVDETKP